VSVHFNLAFPKVDCQSLEQCGGACDENKVKPTSCALASKSLSDSFTGTRNQGIVFQRIDLVL
jgi:hypothetical protein